MVQAVAIETKAEFWTWRGHSIRYQQCGETGPALVLIHGFGASSDHWRKNLPDFGQTHRAFAIDLLGYGRSAKPTPGEEVQYTFETWGELVRDFCREVVGGPAFFVGNSIGCVVALQAAAYANGLLNPAAEEAADADADLFCQGVVMLNCSLRLLHVRKKHLLPLYRSAPAPLMMKLLANTPIGPFFFSRLATPKTLRTVLKQAYGRKEAITDELLELLLGPASEPGAVDVFLQFIQYDHGPLAEDLLPQMRCPVLVLWGEEDPWEPVEQGRAYGEYPMVERFVSLPGLGHCPQDEAPEMVDPLVRDWTLEVAGRATASLN